MKNQAIILRIVLFSCPIFSQPANLQPKAIAKPIAARAAALHGQHKKVLKKQGRHSAHLHNNRVHRAAKPIKHQRHAQHRVIRKNKPAPRVVKKLVVPVPRQHQAAAVKAHVAPQAQKVQNNARECPICQEPNNLYKLACGHEACKDCLHQILVVAVRSHDTGTIKCPMPSCRQPFSQADIDQVANDQALVKTIADLKFREKMAQDPRMRQCPTVDCPYIYLYEGNPEQFTCPQCHQSYCSNCRVKHPHHMTCKQAQYNQKKAGEHAVEEQATEELMRNTTKQCPRCHAPIERKAGCNRMLCANCHYEFCWLCMMKWPGYNKHACPTWGDKVPAGKGKQVPGVHAPAPIARQRIR